MFLLVIETYNLDHEGSLYINFVKFYQMDMVDREGMMKKDKDLIKLSNLQTEVREPRSQVGYKIFRG